MYKIGFVICFLVVSLNGWGQKNQETIAKFIIREAKLNDEDITTIALESKQYLVIYSLEDKGETYLANVWAETERQMFGKIFNIELNEIKETENSYRIQEFTFTWRYTYDQVDSKIKTGNVQLSKIFKTNGITFIMKIIDADLDVFIYKGFMEGSFNFK
jgi:hypothetical protein